MRSSRSTGRGRSTRLSAPGRGWLSTSCSCCRSAWPAVGRNERTKSRRLAALMAPTETLAEQHFLTLEGYCSALGVSVGLLTSSVGKRDRAAAAGASILVGTHALIQEGVDLHDLAVAVVDEQHRFGVEQRAALAEGRSPHVLHMTATPIPRTLALTV